VKSLLGIIAIGAVLLAVFTVATQRLHPPEGVPAGAVNSGSVFERGLWYACSSTGQRSRCEVYYSTGGSPIRWGLYAPRTPDSLYRTRERAMREASVASAFRALEDSAEFAAGKYYVWLLELRRPLSAEDQWTLVARDAGCIDAVISGEARAFEEARGRWIERNDIELERSVLFAARENGLIEAYGEGWVPAGTANPVLMPLSRARGSPCELSIALEPVS